MKAQLVANGKIKEENDDRISRLKKEDQIRVLKISDKKSDIAPLPGQIQVGPFLLSVAFFFVACALTAATTTTTRRSRRALRHWSRRSRTTG
jgi:hypothetical protein